MLGTALLCMYPIMPAFSAQLWQSFRDVASLTENEFDLVSNHIEKYMMLSAVWSMPWICDILGEWNLATKVSSGRSWLQVGPHLWSCRKRSLYGQSSTVWFGRSWCECCLGNGIRTAWSGKEDFSANMCSYIIQSRTRLRSRAKSKMSGERTRVGRKAASQSCWI